MDAKQAKTEVQKCNIEIGVLCEQIVKIRSQYEKEFREMQDANLVKAKK